MPSEQFLHGVDLVQIDDGIRTIQTVSASVIGIVGTAPNADANLFPLNTPVLLLGDLAKAAKLGLTGTLPQALDAIFDQIGAAVVVVRVNAATTAAETKSNIIGKVDAATGQYQGIQALIAASSIVKVTPRILIAPGFSDDKAVGDALIQVANRVRGMAILDAPNTNDAAAIAYRQQFGGKRAVVYTPAVKVWDTVSSSEVVQPVSARAAGLWAWSDNERGFWWSPSNIEILGITGLARPIDFIQGDVNSVANYLNAANVNTVIQDNGFKLWGNHTCASDEMWRLISWVRTVDIINDSVQKAHMWAVDRNITKNYVDDVTGSVNAYLRHLSNPDIGALMGGRCWADPNLNTADQIAARKVYFDFDLCPPGVAEHVIFRSHLNQGYLTEAFA